MKGILATQELWEKERGAIEQEVAQDLSNPEYSSAGNCLLRFRGTPMPMTPWEPAPRSSRRRLPC